MKHLSIFAVLALMLCAAFVPAAQAADFQYVATYDFSKNSPCATAQSTSCVQDIIVVDFVSGTRRVDAVLPAPTTASTLVDLTSPVVTIKNLFGDVVFSGIARARDAAGNLVESNPIAASSVTAKPGGVVKLGVAVN